MFTFTGCLTVVLSIICLASVCAQGGEGLKTPFVVAANEVPVLGGSLDIFGRNFGSDPSAINVLIHTSNEDVIKCVNVHIISPDTAISCSVEEVGTGSSKHIEVIVNGVSNDAGSDDINFAFRRSAPKLNMVSYDNGRSVVRIYGQHFGFNPSLVTVFIDGLRHHVLRVNDSVIACRKHTKYDMYAGSMAVNVEVDSQKSNASMNVFLESSADYDISVDHIGTDNMDGQQDNIAPVSLMTRYRVAALAFIPALAGAVALAGFLIIRRRRMLAASMSASTSDITIEQAPSKCDNHAIVTTTPATMVRDTSMEEIDLNSDKSMKTQQTTQQVTQQTIEQKTEQPDDIYELQRSESSSSSFSSFSSTYSSTNNSPSSYTPNMPSSPKLDGSEFAYETNFAHETNSKRSKTRERIMSTMCDLDEPVSRLGKRSMDSPYFAKQNAFDSPLTTSQEITPSVTPLRSSAHNQQRRSSVLVVDSPRLYNSQESTPTGPGSNNNSGNKSNALHTSQEINQLHANPFDSACVLHSAIQRAAILRANQQQQQQQKQGLKQQATQQQASVIVQGRRASVGAGHPAYVGKRRSSLGTASLHVSALHNSTGITKYKGKQPKPLRSLRTSQYVNQIDEEELTEGDE